jgi:hypothetical protein
MSYSTASVTLCLDLRILQLRHYLQPPGDERLLRVFDHEHTNVGSAGLQFDSRLFVIEGADSKSGEALSISLEKAGAG